MVCRRGPLCGDTSRSRAATRGGPGDGHRMTAALRATSETNDPVRRLKPRMIDSDWLVMRGMAREIRRLAAELGAEGAVVIDYGCGNMPSRPLFQAAGARYLGADFEGTPDIAIAPD